MATCCVTHADDDDWGDVRNRFKTRAEADARFDEMRATGQLVRMIRWENNLPTEVARIEPQPAANSAERFDAVLSESDRRRAGQPAVSDAEIQAQVDAVRGQRREARTTADRGR